MAEVVRYDDGPITLDEFVIDGRDWLPKTALTYSFVNFTPDLTNAAVRSAIAGALQLWDNVTPLSFAEIADSGLPFNDPGATPPAAGDIRIVFGAGNHGDPNPFDGVNGVLAHAFYPPPNGVTAAGDAHFDEAETWTNTDRPNSSQPIDLRTVAAHEFGHSLGLDHAQAGFCMGGTTSLMCPFYTGSHNFLAQDDINGIQAIYGSAPPCPVSTAMRGTSNRKNGTLATLRAFRDDVMLQTPEGQRYVSLLEEHGLELSRLVVLHQALRKDMQRVIKKLLPAVKNVLAEGEATLSRSQVAAIAKLLKDFADKARPELREALEQGQSELRNEDVLEAFGFHVGP
jgi:hypothetical protein